MEPIQASTLESFTAAGTYLDALGSEDIVWDVAPYTPGRYPQVEFDFPPSYWIRTVIRGSAFGGRDFESLSPEAPVKTDVFHLDDVGFLADCTLTGELPIILNVLGNGITTTMRFSVDVTANPGEDHQLTAAIQLDDQLFEGQGPNFEDAMTQLVERLPVESRLICCFSCQYSDYSPAGGQGLSGMMCLRNAKQAYLNVHSKYDLMRLLRDHSWAEDVLETHRCAEHSPRAPGTGYRG